MADATTQQAEANRKAAVAEVKAARVKEVASEGNKERADINALNDKKAKYNQDIAEKKTGTLTGGFDKEEVFAAKTQVDIDKIDLQSTVSGRGLDSKTLSMRNSEEESLAKYKLNAGILKYEVDHNGSATGLGQDAEVRRLASQAQVSELIADLDNERVNPKMDVYRQKEKALLREIAAGSPDGEKKLEEEVSKLKSAKDSLSSTEAAGEVRVTASEINQSLDAALKSQPITGPTSQGRPPVSFNDPKIAEMMRDEGIKKIVSDALKNIGQQGVAASDSTWQPSPNNKPPAEIKR